MKKFSNYKKIQNRERDNDKIEWHYVVTLPAFLLKYPVYGNKIIHCVFCLSLHNCFVLFLINYQNDIQNIFNSQNNFLCFAMISLDFMNSWITSHFFLGKAAITFVFAFFMLRKMYGFCTKILKLSIHISRISTTHLLPPLYLA